MRYEGDYSGLEKKQKGNSLSGIQLLIENAAGFDRHNPISVFKEYTTTWISEYNWMGRETAQHYFSMRDRNWHRSPNKITRYNSWYNAKQPFKAIAQWLLEKLGYRDKQNEETRKFIQEQKINSLYGK